MNRRRDDARGSLEVRERFLTAHCTRHRNVRFVISHILDDFTPYPKLISIMAVSILYLLKYLYFR